MLAALKPQARASGPGRAGFRLQIPAPTSIQNSGANKPSTAFSLAVSAAARRISGASRSAVSRPTIHARAWRAGWRAASQGMSPASSAWFCTGWFCTDCTELGRAFSTPTTACSRLRPARALARATTSRGVGASRSIPQPARPLPPTSSSVIKPPASRSFQALVPAQASAPRRSRVIHQPITTTGWGHQRGSPTRRSRAQESQTSSRGLLRS